LIKQKSKQNNKTTKQQSNNMKKQIISILAAGGLAVSAFAQGSINTSAYLSNDPGVTTQGVNATLTTLAEASPLWFTGQLSLAIYEVGTMSGATYSLATINSYLNVSGGASIALGDLTADGYVEASTTTYTGSTVGSVTGNMSEGYFPTAFSPGNIGLTGVPTATSAYLALVGTVLNGADVGYSGVIAFANSTGGNPNQTPTAGTPATLTGWNTLNENLVLSPVVASPEPATMALVGLGSLSLMLFRRKIS
jgi:hypothetical protein